MARFDLFVFVFVALVACIAGWVVVTYDLSAVDAAGALKDAAVFVATSFTSLCDAQLVVVGGVFTTIVGWVVKELVS